MKVFFIDGEHDYRHPYKEALEIFKHLPKIVIWHDANIKEVEASINKVFEIDGIYFRYDLFRVTDTRVAYALRKEP